MLHKYRFLLIGVVALALGTLATYVIACCPNIKTNQVPETISNGTSEVCTGWGTCSFKVNSGPPLTWSVECTLATTGCPVSYTRTDGHGECNGGPQQGTKCQDTGVDWYDHHFVGGKCKSKILWLGCDYPEDNYTPAHSGCTYRGDSFQTVPC